MAEKLPHVISGHAIVGEDLTLAPVDITVEHGIITGIDDAAEVPDLLICPALFNAHTHLGDTVAMDCAVTGDLEAMVSPPDGLKHKLLNAAAPVELIAGMRKSIRLMADRGTAGCADFREGGPAGVAALRKAAAGLPFRTLIFGRDGGERVADGIGISSARDIPDAADRAAETRKSGKLVAFHAGEKDALDIDAALACDPDLIVHATYATDAHLRECAEREIPIVICPQSNWILSVAHTPDHPPVRRMLEQGCKIYLGTDNAMFVQPDMMGAMAFLHTVYHVRPTDVFRMAVTGSSLAGEPFYLKRGAHANFIIFNSRRSNLAFSKDPVASVVKRGYSLCPCKNVFNL